MYYTRDTEDKEVILDAVNKIASRITSTMGPRGRYVLIDDTQRVKSTKDGAQVAKYQNYEDRTESLIAKMVLDACLATEKYAGDGTTLTALLIQKMVKVGFEMIEKGQPSTSVASVFQDFVTEAIKSLKESKIDVVKEGKVDLALLHKVCMTSSNGNTEVSRIVTEMFDKLGQDSLVQVLMTEQTETTTQIKEGYSLNTGMVSNLFFRSGDSIRYEKPLILLTNQIIDRIEQLAPAMKAWQESPVYQKRPLVIFCNGCHGTAMQNLLMNFQRNGIQIAVIENPSHADTIHILRDIQLISGAGNIFSPISGATLKKFSTEGVSDFGEVESIEINLKTTALFYDKEGSTHQGDLSDLIPEHIDEILDMIKENPDSAPLHRMRIARLTGGIGVINIGAPSHAARENLKDSYDDTYLAARAACMQGVVIGGGMALPTAMFGYMGLFELGEIIDAPLVQIMANADCEDYHGKYAICLKNPGNTITFNGTNIEVVHAVKRGILDPYLSIEQALTNAFSVAEQIIRTSYFQYLEHHG